MTTFFHKNPNKPSKNIPSGMEKWGYNSRWEEIRQEKGWSGFSVGRVAIEHRERYIVRNEKGEHLSEVLGNLLYSAESKRDLPSVGDWVAILEYDEGKAIIHGIFPRYGILERQAVGKKGEKQIIILNNHFFAIRNILSINVCNCWISSSTGMFLSRT
jgi:ribosome biogenesis GTPase / thiamine phosphate phosphatase